MTSKPSLRGFSGDRFLLTKDGDETGDLAQSSIDHVITLDMTEVQNIELIRGDLRKIDDLLQARDNCFALVHLGGIVGDPACSVDEKLTKDINLTATKIIGQIAKAAGVSKFIFASSCSVYGEPREEYVSEDHNLSPVSYYGFTKLQVEKINLLT